MCHKQKALVVAVLAFCIQTAAESKNIVNAGIPTIIELANEQVQSVGRPQCTQDQELLLNNCIGKICPADGMHIYLGDLYEKIVQSTIPVDPVFESEIKPLLTTIFDLKIKVMAAENKSGLSRLAEANSAPEQQEVGNRSFFFRQRSLMPTEYVFDKNSGKVEMKIDEKKVHEALKHLPSEQLEWLIKADKLFNEGIDRCSSDFNALFPEYYLIRKYGEDVFTNTDKANKILQKEAQELEKQITVFCTTDYKPNILSYMKSEIEKSSAMDRQQKDQYLENYAKTLNSDQCLSMMLSETIKEMSRSSLPATLETFKVLANEKSIFCSQKFGFSKEFSDIIRSLPGKGLIKNKTYSRDLEEKLKQRAKSIEEIQKNPDKAKLQLVDQCRKAYQVSLAMLPDNLDSSKFTVMINRAKSLVMSKALRFLSQPSQRKMAEQIIPNLVFVPPPAKSSFKDKFKNGLRIQTNDLQKKLENFETGYGSMNLDYAKDRSNIDVDLLQLELSSACNQHSISLIPDQTYTPEGGITVGPLSVMEPKFGIPTIMHEIGHNVSDQLKKANNLSEQSQNIYKNVMNCLAQKHNERTDGFYSEEDFADFIEASGLDDSDTNPWCAIVRDSKKVSLVAADSIINLTSSDVHSSTLFRLLHETQIQKGTLPDDCSKFLTQTNQNRDFSNCVGQQQTTH